MKRENWRKNLLLMLFACLCLCGLSMEAQAKTKLQKVVEAARKNYYTTEDKIDSGQYKRTGEKGICFDYWDGKDRLRKGITYYKKNRFGEYDPDVVSKCTAEFFYDKNAHLVFAFAYRKVHGKLKTYRAYYGTNGKLYRYIGPDGKVKNYKKGKSPYSLKKSAMARKLYYAGSMHSHLLGVT